MASSCVTKLSQSKNVHKRSDLFGMAIVDDLVSFQSEVLVHLAHDCRDRGCMLCGMVCTGFQHLLLVAQMQLIGFQVQQEDLCLELQESEQDLQAWMLGCLHQNEKHSDASI